MVRARYLAAAVGFAILLIAGAPFVSELRGAIARAFPLEARAIIGGVVAVAIAAALMIAALRIRGAGAGDPVGERRAFRYLALGTALIVGASFARALRTGDPNTDVVETFHFVEYGALTLLFYLAWRPIDDVSVLVLPMLAGLLVGTLDEWFQWFIPSRVGELRDVMLDGVAVACGLFFSVGVDPPAHFTLGMRRGSAVRIGAMCVLLTLVFALFLQSVHIGYEVRDPQVGVFRSRYTAAELGAAAADRDARWREAPLLVAGRVSREDQYFSEALWHVRRRNQAASAGDVLAAWRENRILETFYEPVLDHPTYVSRAGLRWPAEQRVDFKNRAPDDGRPYVSDAEPYGIYLWPKATFWMVVALVIAVTVTVFAIAHKRARPIRV
jgi:hypothetical protein